MTSHEGTCGTDYKLNLTNTNYDIRISRNYENETLDQIYYTQLHRIWF